MSRYRYTFISAKIPSIPILSFQLTTPDLGAGLRIDCKGILDTGSDVTLVPLPLIMRLNIKAAGRFINIPFSGVVTVGVSYEVGLIFDKYALSPIRVYGSPVDAMGEYLIIGRDLLNRYRIEFDGPNETFEIF